MPLTKIQQSILITLSFLIVAFGQPVWSSILSILCYLTGFALFFRLLICFEKKTQRFWLATAWFGSVQLVQLSWFLSHPYFYIVSVHFLVSLIYGLQFGVIALLVEPKKMTHLSRLISITSCWTLMELLRLFVLSGFAFNPIGLSLSGHLYTLQMASFWGVFGMSYWVLLVNLLGLRVWLNRGNLSSSLIWISCVLLPFGLGYVQLKMNDFHPTTSTFNAVLIQPVFPIEESLKFRDTHSFIKFVEDEWRQILILSKEHRDKDIDLMALPEFIVPFATYTPVFRFDDVKNIFIEVFGKDVGSLLPALQEPLATVYKTSEGSVWMVSNGYWLQGMSNVFNTAVVAGMEDVEDFTDGRREYYSSAQHTEPLLPRQSQSFNRYDKRILVPMGEYIPFSFCRSLASAYGISGSFTPGKEAKIFSCKVPFGVSICFEETFGHLMRENRLNGAELLVNLTSDAWYPTLAQQHCDHARLRTVENGIPLIRACNTGITCGFDCLGRELKVLGNTAEEKISKSGALYLEVPIASYYTLYSQFGDYLILMVCCVGIAWALWKHEP